MKKILLRLAPLAGLLCFAGAHAATTSTPQMMLVWTDSVAPADVQAYEAGVKAVVKYVADHHFRYGERAVTPVTGNNTFEYTYITGPMTWADFDAWRSAFMATGCDSLAASQIVPHLQGSASALLKMSPDPSYLPAGGMPNSGFYEVVSFTLNSGPKAYEAFISAAKKIYAAANKYKWPQYSALMEVHDAGAGAPDFIGVIPHKNWADFNPQGPDLWARLAQAYGKKEADAIRQQLNNAIDHVSGHIDHYDADLSYQPSER